MYKPTLKKKIKNIKFFIALTKNILLNNVTKTIY